jgi:hypothetical protein
MHQSLYYVRLTETKLLPAVSPMYLGISTRPNSRTRGKYLWFPSTIPSCEWLLNFFRQEYNSSLLLQDPSQYTTPLKIYEELKISAIRSILRRPHDTFPSSHSTFRKYSFPPTPLFYGNTSSEARSILTPSNRMNAWGKVLDPSGKSGVGPVLQRQDATTYY